MSRIEPTLGKLTDFADSMRADARYTNPAMTTRPQAKRPQRATYSKAGYLGFSGRLSQLRYITMFVLCVIYLPVTAVLFLIFEGYVSSVESILPGTPDSAFPIVLALFLAQRLFVLFLIVKRLHDISLSGIWSLLWFVPGLGTLVALLIGLFPGSPGANKYGAPNADMNALSMLFAVLVILSFLGGVPYMYLNYYSGNDATGDNKFIILDLPDK